MSLVYIEYVSRLPGVSVEQFHFAAGLQDSWSDDYADDVLVLNLGRTFRTGPEPSYLAVWHRRPPASSASASGKPSSRRVLPTVWRRPSSSGRV